VTVFVADDVFVPVCVDCDVEVCVISVCDDVWVLPCAT